MNPRHHVWSDSLASQGIFSLLVVLGALLAVPQAATAADLKIVGISNCDGPERSDCKAVDAVVFVHGIYGDETTFINPETNFDWPLAFSRVLGGRRIDVYRLKYANEMVSWAEADNPSFQQLSADVMDALKPLRVKNYRTIGFIAHSLGGNVISTYIHRVKTKIGHPQRAQNAFVITLATPVLGSQWASLGSTLKSLLHMNDGLLDSLSKDNLYLKMLNQFREDEVDKALRYACRPLALHAAYEEKDLGPILVVTPGSAAIPISNMVASPVVGFQLDHSAIAKPKDRSDVVFTWVQDRVESEYRRIATWEAAHAGAPDKRKLCEEIDFKPETP